MSYIASVVFKERKVYLFKIKAIMLKITPLVTTPPLQ